MDGPIFSYEMTTCGASHFQAETYCYDRISTLVTVKTQDEAKSIRANIMRKTSLGDGGFWIGRSYMYFHSININNQQANI